MVVEAEETGLADGERKALEAQLILLREQQEREFTHMDERLVRIEQRTLFLEKMTSFRGGASKAIMWLVGSAIAITGAIVAVIRLLK